MKLTLNIEQVKVAIAVYINDQKLVNVQVLPEHVSVLMKAPHGYDDDAEFDGIVIDLSEITKASASA